MTEIRDEGSIETRKTDDTLRDMTSRVLNKFSREFPRAEVHSFSVRWHEEDKEYKYRISAKL